MLITNSLINKHCNILFVVWILLLMIGHLME